MLKTCLWSAAVLVVIGLLSYFSILALRSPALPRGILYGNGHIDIEGTEIAVSAGKCQNWVLKLRSMPGLQRVPVPVSLSGRKEAV